MLLSILTSRLGLVGAAFALTLLFYEGVPFINRIPYLEHVPIVAELGVGRVEIQRREAAAAERAAWERQMADLRAKAAADLAERVDQIATIEREYLLNRAGDAIEIAKLKEVIDDLERSEGSGPSRPVAIPGKLSTALDAIGRRRQ